MITLSVFFSFDKVYFAVLERNRRGLHLLDIGSTLDPINLDDIDSELSKKAISQLNRSLKEIEFKIEELNVVINNDNVLIAPIPDVKDSADELKQLINLEIKQQYPQATEGEFTTKIYPLHTGNDTDDMLLALIVSNELIGTLENVLEITGLDISYFTTSQFAAINCLEYNYPETNHLSRLVVGISEEFGDVSLSNNCTPSVYELVNRNDDDTLVENLNDKIQDILDRKMQIGAAFLYGNMLNKPLLNKLKETDGKFEEGYQRLNAFRFVRTKLDERHKQYAIRTAHIFPPVIGAALSGYDKAQNYSE